MTFNDLLTSAGINPSEVCAIRHQTPKPGKVHATVHDLWRNNLQGFQRYQATQRAAQPVFRTRKIWAAFVRPTQDKTIFVGLYDATLTDTRKADWLCDYQGNEPEGGKPVDIFETRLRSELSEQIGVLNVDWPANSQRSWARYAEHLVLPVSTGQSDPQSSPLFGTALINELTKLGFLQTHATKKLVQLRCRELLVYVNLETKKRPLVLHPHYSDLAGGLHAIGGVDVPDPGHILIHSNLRAFPTYVSDHRVSKSRYGFPIGINANSLPALIRLLRHGATVSTPEGNVCVVTPDDEPLTEREQIQVARKGQGAFRDRLMMYWKFRCPVTGVDHPALLRASHIKPWSDASNSERLDPFNGILLCSHVDALFDRKLITFEDDGRIKISPLVTTKNRERLGLDPSIKITGLDMRHLPYLAHHRNQLLK